MDKVLPTTQTTDCTCEKQEVELNHVEYFYNGYLSTFSMLSEL